MGQVMVKTYSDQQINCSFEDEDRLRVGSTSQIIPPSSPNTPSDMGTAP